MNDQQNVDALRKLRDTLTKVAICVHFAAPLLGVYAMYWMGMRHGGGRTLCGTEAIVLLTIPVVSSLAAVASIGVGVRLKGLRMSAGRWAAALVPILVSIAEVRWVIGWGVG